jgi:hypothetical protein
VAPPVLSSIPAWESAASSIRPHAWAWAIDTIEGIQRNSVDYYASLRSLHRQLRASHIRNGAAEKTPDLPDF